MRFSFFPGFLLVFLGHSCNLPPGRSGDECVVLGVPPRPGQGCFLSTASVTLLLQVLSFKTRSRKTLKYGCLQSFFPNLRFTPLAQVVLIKLQKSIQFCSTSDIMASVVREGVARAEFVRERVVRAVVLPCGTKGNFRGEVYEFAEPVQAEDGLSTPGTFFWLFRWVVDFLGGNQIPNFGGRMRATLLGRMTDLLADGLSSSEEDEKPLEKEVKEEDVREEAEDSARPKAKVPIADQHMTVSSVMTRLSDAKRKSKGGAEEDGARRKSRRKGDEDVDMEVTKEELDSDEGPEQEAGRGDSSDEETAPAPLLRGDFSLSSVCLLAWLSQLMVKGPRAGSRWMLEAAEIKARCRAFLQALCDTFWQNVQGEVFQVVQGQLSVEVLAAAEGKVATKIFAKKKTVEVVEAMVVLQGDATRRSLSMDRRRLAEKLFSRLLQSLAKAIDGSRGQEIWTATKVESLEQLRTASSVG